MRCLACLLLTLALAGCVPEPDLIPKGGLLSEYHGLFVLNEGQWNQSNATLDYYGPDGGRISEVFYRTNGLRLGDVANSVLLDQDTLYIVMNGSRLLYKVQLPGLHLIAQLEFPELASPRSMVKVSPTLAYVNSLYSQVVYKLNPQTMTLTGTLTVEDHMEDMVLHQDKVYIGCGNYPGKTNNKLAIIDPTTELVTYRTLPVENPGAVVLLADGQLAICCRGNYATTNSAVVFYNPGSDVFTDTVHVDGYLYDMTATPTHLLMVSDYDLSAISLADHSLTYRYLSRQALGAKSTDLLYALHYEPVTDRIYLTNAGYGAQNGQCYVLNRQLQLLQTLDTGVFPGTVFYYP